MSVFDSTSPMSVDKSIQNDELCKETPIKSLKRLPKLQRDTFYEVVEYQADIVKYLKSIEVRFCFWFNPFLIVGNFVGSQVN